MNYFSILSSELPENHIKTIRNLTFHLCSSDYKLRCGGNDFGMDAYALTGAKKSNSSYEIYEQWLNGITKEDQLKAYEFAVKNWFDDNFYNMQSATQKQVVRYVFIIMGLNLDTPSKFIIDYPGGNFGKEFKFSLHLAKKLNIPVFDISTDIDKIKSIANLC